MFNQNLKPMKKFKSFEYRKVEKEEGTYLYLFQNSLQVAKVRIPSQSELDVTPDDPDAFENGLSILVDNYYRSFGVSDVKELHEFLLALIGGQIDY